MAQRSRRRLVVLMVGVGLGCMVAALTLVAGRLGASSARAAGRSPVISFYFGLRRPESQAVAAFFAVEQPGGRTYRRFSAPRQISRRYGASMATRVAFTRAIRRLGLTSRIDPSGVFARVSGTPRQLGRAFHVRITSVFQDNATSYQAVGRLRLSGALRPLVREVVAAYAKTSRPPSGVGPRRGLGVGRAPGNAGTWVDGCNAARATGAYSFAQVRHAYRLDAVGSGAGGTVAILGDQEGVPQQDILANARCFHLPANRVRAVFTDGQTRPFGRESFEPQEDLALVRGMAPHLRSVLLTGVWGAPSLWFLGPAKLLTVGRLPDALTISYGYCERQFLASSAARQGSSLLGSMFVRLGLAGVPVFGSAGDSGSTCNGVSIPGVAWPASSPYVTVVGGTRLVLNRRNARVNEVVWNDLKWLTPDNGGGAGGGGVSSFYPRPPYQRGIGVGGSPPGGARRSRPRLDAPGLADRERRPLDRGRGHELRSAAARLGVRGDQREAARRTPAAARAGERAALLAAPSPTGHDLRHRLRRQPVHPKGTRTPGQAWV